MALSASDVPALYSLLANSMSADHRLRAPAEEALAQSESRPGFCSCLLELITANDLASQVDVRLMATVYFKNSINRYWRQRRDSSGISNEEKMHLRQKLLMHLREESDQIALMLAVIISKIARIDYPKEWPDIFLILSQQLQSADVLASHRIFMILFRTLKELSTKRLTADQRNFAEISSQFFDYSWRLWQSDVQTLLHGFSALSQNYNSNADDQHRELHLTCERWLLCSKIIRQLIISGFQSDSKCFQEVRPVKEVSPVLLSAIQSFLPYYSSFQKQYPKFWDFVKRACTKLMKILVAIQGRHPYSFGDKFVLSSVMDFCLNRITDPEPNLLSFEQFLIQCMVMIKNILECKEYKPCLTGRVVDEKGVTLEQMKKNISSAVGGVVTSLLPNDRIVLLCNVLVKRYFVLTASDLEEWYRSPESFHHEQDMVQWTEKLRPCAEALYIILFENNSQLLAPVVVSLLQETMNNCPTSVTEITSELLLKDAAYGAAAYVYYELSNYLSFKDWFNGALSHELSNDHPNLRIIHRKVAVILGQWVSEIKDETKRPVYCALIRLLQGKDLSVRLAACRSLCLHVEDANFSEREFVDLLPLCWDSCFKLFEEVQEFDSKVQILNLISILIGHVSQVIPFANKLVQFFQKVWEESAGESLLQIQLLVALRNFVIALGYQSPICYNILLPLLENGIDINSPDELNLLEDSMLLWEATLSQAPSMVPQLLSYFSRLVGIMERNFDHLQVAVSIIEDYIILGGNDFLSMHATNIAKILDLVVGNVNDKGLLSILPVVDILIQCFPMEVPPLISNTLQKLIVLCLSGGDDRDPSKTSVKASSAAILARVLVMNTNSLAQLASDPSTNQLLQPEMEEIVPLTSLSNEQQLMLKKDAEQYNDDDMGLANTAHKIVKGDFQRVEGNRVYLRMAKEEVTENELEKLIEYLDRKIALPNNMYFDDFKYENGQLSFQIIRFDHLKRNADKRVNSASGVAQAVYKRRKDIQSLSGVQVDETGIGSGEDAVPVERADRDWYFVPTLAICALTIMTLISVLAVHLIKNRRNNYKNNLPQVIDNTESKAATAYEDLCRQRMSNQDVPTGVCIGAPPTKTGSTSSWPDESLYQSCNLDISTGHVILSFLQEHLDNPGKIADQWNSVSGYYNSSSITTIALEPQNIDKNRDRTVLPYDDNVVTISEGYVNASKIHDSDPYQCSYIITQAPMEHTIPDYWQLVWEQGVALLVNLCQIDEAERYWPDEGSQVYGSFEVNLVSEHIWSEDYVVRSFYLKSLKTGETRTVTQFHYLSWKKNGVPASNKSLLEFKKKVNKSYRGRSSPILLHDFNGGGRSGTYCLIDIVSNRINKGVKEIDIAASLEHLRDQRPFLVANGEQYKMVFSCVAEEVTSMIKSIQH